MVTKHVLLDGEKTKLSASAMTAVDYLNEFGTDIFDDIEDWDQIVMENLAYIMSGADMGIDTWLDSLSINAIRDIRQDVIDLWKNNSRTIVEEYSSKGSGRKITTPLILLRCTQIGLTIEALKYLTLGNVLDIFTERMFDNGSGVRKATQEDFDRF